MARWCQRYRRCSPYRWSNRTDWLGIMPLQISIMISSYLGIAWFVELRRLTEPGRQPEWFQVFEAAGERLAPAGIR